MTTTMKDVARFFAAVALATLAACGNGSNNGTADMAMGGGGGGGGGGGSGDMAITCASNPMTPVELLNACTSAQTGDPNKDAPYFPSLAPGGNLPPLP